MKLTLQSFRQSWHQLGLAALTIFVANPALAQDSEQDIAKQLANPIANLISVPFQSNLDCCFGPDRAHRYTLNIQPVIPLTLNEQWNLITRTIVPVIHQERLSPALDEIGGLGDTVQSFFFSPKQTVDGITWGIGPVFLYPTGHPRLGSEKFGLGPTAVVLKQEGGWTYGILANQIWSVAGPSGRQDVNATFVQPFITYTFPDTTAITLNTETTYDWTSEAWTVPINVNVSRVFKFGEQRVSLGVGGRYYVESPTGGPEWGLRSVATLLFPK